MKHAPNSLDVTRTAELAAIALSPAEAQALEPALAEVLALLSALDALDLDDVPPTLTPRPTQGRLRPDTPEAPLDRDTLLAQAPQHDGSAFVVPQVIG